MQLKTFDIFLSGFVFRVRGGVRVRDGVWDGIRVRVRDKVSIRALGPSKVFDEIARNYLSSKVSQFCKGYQCNAKLYGNDSPCLRPVVPEQ